MSKLKDKLSANMRMVKASQKPASAQSANKPVAKPAAAKPVASAAPKKTTARAPAVSKTTTGEIPASGTALFPSRVWPD